MVIAQVTRARSHTDDVEWSAEDGTRTEFDFLCRCVEAAIKAGATTINIPDTVGYTVPEEYFKLMTQLREARAELRPGALLGALPQRSRHGGGQFARRHQRRRAADRMHHQRHRRAGRQRRARRGRDGDERAQRRAAVLDRHRHHHADARLQARVGGDLVPGAVQQGDRRPQRLRARERHPPGRHAQAHPDLRDHDAGDRRREADLAGDGQALRPPRLRAQAGGAGLQARRQPARGRLRALQGAGRPQEADLRRGHRGAGRRGDRARPGSRQARLAVGDRRHARAAARHHEARHRGPHA